MSLLQDLTKANLRQFGIQGLSFTMPASTTKWVNENNNSPALSVSESQLTISSAGRNWLAPFSGILNEVNSSNKKIRFSLQQADGRMVNTTGVLLRLLPQQVLRLKRLVALKLEDGGSHNPRRNDGLAKRQVPAFVFLANGTVSGITEGMIHAGDDLGFDGALSFYDEQGHILHPVYVASLMKVLLNLYPALNIDAALNNQLNSIIALSSANAATVRIIKPDGAPYNGQHLEGVTSVETDSGLYSINTYSGSDTAIRGEVRRSAATAADGAFPPSKAQQLVMGNICYGRYLDNVPLLKLPTGITLEKDFFTVKVIELERYLKGSPNAAFNGSKLEPAASLRLHEQLSFLPTGNEVMGKIAVATTGTNTEALCVGTLIDTKLPLPQNDTDVRWPQFPALPAPGTIPPGNDTFPAGLKAEVRQFSRADFLPDSGGGQPTDVLLRLSGIPFGAAIRVFNRVFLPDAVVKRGDGAGGVCSAEEAAQSGRTLNGTLSLVLKDPLGLRRSDGTVTVPTQPKLTFDLMIVLHNGDKRLFGALELPVTNTPGPTPTPADNALASVSKQSVSRAGILGLNTNTASLDFSSFNALLNSVLTMLQDTQPRDAGRLPSMMRRDLLVAARKSSGWSAVLSAGQITGNLHNAEQDAGCPGSPGGKETANVGISTQNGRLAYDIARMAFRRTTNFYDRLVALADDLWNEPAATTALGENEAPGAANGTFTGVLAQNIAPYCETPELALLKSAVEANIDSIPATFDDLVDRVNSWINDVDTTGLPGPLDTAANRLKTELVNRLNTLKDNNALSESTKERLYNEVKRELSAACFGRRDSQWALQQAISQARHSIYIETPGFSFTKGSADADYALDLVTILTQQLQARPGLRVILCVPRQPDYSKQYDQWIRSEVKERWEIISALPANQVVVFHPVGFPGRPSNLEHHTVIVDDQWMLTGSSAFRRRGLCFDGSSDLICTDLAQDNGVAGSIKALRLALLKQRLGIPPADTGSRALMTEDFTAAFGMIRQMLISGGLGKIQRLWNGHTDGVAYTDPTINRELANPDGISFNLLEASVFTAFAGMAT